MDKLLQTPRIETDHLLLIHPSDTDIFNDEENQQHREGEGNQDQELHWTHSQETHSQEEGCLKEQQDQWSEESIQNLPRPLTIKSIHTIRTETIPFPYNDMETDYLQKSSITDGCNALCSHQISFFECEVCTKNPHKFQSYYSQDLQELMETVNKLPRDLQIVWSQIMQTTTKTYKIPCFEFCVGLQTQSVFEAQDIDRHNHCLQKLSSLLTKSIPCFTGPRRVDTMFNNHPNSNLSWDYMLKNTPSLGWENFGNKIQSVLNNFDDRIKQRCKLPTIPTPYAKTKGRMSLQTELAFINSNPVLPGKEWINSLLEGKKRPISSQCGFLLPFNIFEYEGIGQILSSPNKTFRQKEQRRGSNQQRNLSFDDPALIRVLNTRLLLILFRLLSEPSHQLYINVPQCQLNEIFNHKQQLGFLHGLNPIASVFLAPFFINTAYNQLTGCSTLQEQFFPATLKAASVGPSSCYMSKHGLVLRYSGKKYDLF